jgi:hypothetical protein
MTRRSDAAFLLFTIALTCAAAPASAQSVGRRYALLIGVSSSLKPTAVPKLNFVDNDVEELGQLLKRQGFEVKTVPNESADRERIVKELYAHALTLTEQDTFVLYYAGHGVRNIEVNRKTYWLTYDAELDMLDVQGIRLEHLLSYVDDIRAGRKLVLLDHCFSGDVANLRIVSDFVPPPAPPAPPPPADPTAAPPPPPAPPRAGTTGPVLVRTAEVVEVINQELVKRDTTTVIAAARDVAYELRTLRHGVFTKALLDACTIAPPNGGDYKRSILELLRFLQPQVDALLKQAGAPKQKLVEKLPDVVSALDWDLCVLPVPAAEVAARATQYGAAIQTWETKGLLNPLRRVACTEILDKWKNAGGDASALTLREQRVLAAIRLFADSSDTVPEQVRAASVADMLNREGY